MKSWALAGGLAGVCLSVSWSAVGAGISVDEMSVRRLGDAFSGGAAESVDASSVWYNPAAITRLGQGQLSGGLIAIPHETRFRGDVFEVGEEHDGSPISGHNKTWTGTEVIPDFYAVLPVTDRLWFGAGVNSPWGTGTKFDRTWIGRYQSIESNLLTINLLTVVGWQATGSLSIGGGLVTEYADGEIKKAIPFGESMASDGFFKGSGDDTAQGFIAGIHYQPAPDWQLGINYRSEIKHKLDGHMQIDGPEGFIYSPEKFDASLKLTIPETVSFSAVHDVFPGWTLKADVTWTRWSRFDELRFQPKNSGKMIKSNDPQVQTMDWHDSWRFALGTEYQLNSAWTVRAGVAYDDSPTPNHTATIDFAVGDYRAVSIGATWDVTADLGIDMALQHTWTTRRTVTDDAAFPWVIVRAHGEVVNRINSLGVGLRWRF